MINIIFDPYLFMRTPALSYEDYQTDILADLLKKQFFRAAIFFASESLYMELKRYDFDYRILDKKVKLSLQKYFNRMCHRPTPFGMFSAFSSLNWSVFEDAEGCILEDEKEVYINPDFQFTAEVARKMERSAEFNNVKYYSNDTIYTIKGEKRYLTNRLDSDKRKTDFFINSFQSDRLLNKLLNFCKTGKTKTELTEWLCMDVDDADEVKNYIEDLVSEGLLITGLCPNMTGTKYFDRLANIAAEKEGQSELADEILRYGEIIAGIKTENDLDITAFGENELYMAAKKKFKSMFYVASERKSNSSLDKKYQGYIHDGLICLNKITTDAAPASLTNFKSKFIARFEDQEIPILQALDREAGIGYQGLESNLITSELLEGIQLDLQSNSLNFNWTPIHEFFLSRFLNNRNSEPIIITEKDLEKLKGQSELKLPPSFSVVFRAFGDKVWIEQAGGCTGTALLGRFTLFNEKILEEAGYIASVEEKSNEDVIFAEISCFNDEHAANINSNAGIRAYEIPIGVHSTLNRENIISLADITISVVANNIVLRSKKLNKIIIPRLSSAFNYSRSELSVFRFLCDLQYQGLKFNFNFDLRSLLPGLGFYPRVEYKNSILFPSTWVLTTDEIVEITDNADPHESFYKMCEKTRLNRHFALTEGDNQLLFDQQDYESVDLFVKVIKNKQTIVLQEVFFDPSATVTDREGKPYTGQFIATVFADETTYSQQNMAPYSSKKNKVKRFYLPGDEWVYLKLYCHPATSNAILTKDIKRITAHLKKQNILKSWFFVRYNDPDHHLRIRVQINPRDAGEVVKYFDKKIRRHVEKGSVNNLLLDTYKREIERYGEEMIGYAEEIFHVSSELIINYLKNFPNNDSGFSELHLAIVSVDEFLEVFFPELADKIFLLKNIHENMKHEFDDSKQVKLQLDGKYREYSGFINNMHLNKAAIVHMAGKKEYNSFIKALKLLKSNAAALPAGKLMKFAADLVHMHLNRLFNDRQRNHEFIIYYLLYKYYLSVQARREKELLGFTAAPKHFRVNYIDEAVFK